MSALPDLDFDMMGAGTGKALIHPRIVSPPCDPTKLCERIDMSLSRT